MKEYGEEWAAHFFVEAAATLVVEEKNRAPFAVTRLVSEVVPPEITTSIGVEDSFLIPVALESMPKGGWDHWIDGRPQHMPAIPALHTNVFDLRSEHIAWLKTTFDHLVFNFPRATIDSFLDSHGLSRVATLRTSIGVDDPVIANLTRIMLSLMRGDTEPSELLLDHFALLFCSRLVEGYTDTSLVKELRTGGLAPWQRRSVEELLLNHLGGDLKLARLAKECNVSPGHFAKAFKATYGISVHRWVVDRRIERAKVLLRQGEPVPLVDIAYRTGFASQATFTRAFQQRVGTSPGHWRRSMGASRSHGLSRSSQDGR